MKQAITAKVVKITTNKAEKILLNSGFKKKQAQVILSKITNFCQHWKILEMSLFGSVLRDDFTRESDVDVLVEFEQGKTPGLAIITMEDELSNIINRQIDLRTSADLSRYFREQVLAEAIVIYEQN